MPHRPKKKFIEKKSSVTFNLVHRSQRDPLAADDEAPQRVLMPGDECAIECDVVTETPREREDRISAQREYGVSFDDDYNYMQHLRAPEDKPATILLPKYPTFQKEEFFEDSPETEYFTRKDNQSLLINIPSLALPSKDEEEIGLLHRAIPPVGPQVDWDPDIVAAMDDDFDYDDPENILENDFMLLAMAGGDSDDNSMYGEQDRDIPMSDNDSTTSSGPNNEFFDQFLEEETKSRFTEYSMTSSVLPRTEQLKLLDEQFEKFFENYDADKIGALSQYEVDGTIPVHDISQNDVVRRLLGIKEEAHETGNLVEPQVQSRNAGAPTTQESIDEDELSEEGESESEDDVKLVKFYLPEKPKYDCESILSTYSNKYNHPKMIYDDDISNKPIKLSKKTGIPLDTLPTRGLTAKQLRALDLQNLNESSDRMRTTSETSIDTLKSEYVRRKDETKEEKTARKKLVKDIQRERRVEKKATKCAFKRERSRQGKELMNIQRNLKGIRL